MLPTRAEFDDVSNDDEHILFGTPTSNRDEAAK
jgi:hypothetical protein